MSEVFSGWPLSNLCFHITVFYSKDVICLEGEKRVENLVG